MEVCNLNQPHYKQLRIYHTGIHSKIVRQTMMWDKSTIKMKEYEDLLDINSPVNEFYWHEESYESQVLNDASSHHKKILVIKYKNIGHKIRASRLQ